MKLPSAQGAAVSALGRILDVRPHGSSIFAAGMLAFLLIIVGIPMLMVVLMSLRTGFPAGSWFRKSWFPLREFETSLERKKSTRSTQRCRLDRNKPV